MGISECFQLIQINACWPNVMRVEQRMHRQNTPQGNFTILPTEVANLPTETGSGGDVAHPPTSPPLAPGLNIYFNFYRMWMDSIKSYYQKELVQQYNIIRHIRKPWLICLTPRGDTNRPGFYEGKICLPAQPNSHGIVDLLSQTILSMRCPKSRHTLGTSLTSFKICAYYLFDYIIFERK